MCVCVHTHRHKHQVHFHFQFQFQALLFHPLQLLRQSNQLFNFIVQIRHNCKIGQNEDPQGSRHKEGKRGRRNEGSMMASSEGKNIPALTKESSQRRGHINIACVL